MRARLKPLLVLAVTWTALVGLVAVAQAQPGLHGKPKTAQDLSIPTEFGALFGIKSQQQKYVLFFVDIEQTITLVSVLGARVLGDYRTIPRGDHTPVEPPSEFWKRTVLTSIPESFGRLQAVSTKVATTATGKQFSLAFVDESDVVRIIDVNGNKLAKTCVKIDPGAAGDEGWLEHTVAPVSGMAEIGELLGLTRRDGNHILIFEDSEKAITVVKLQNKTLSRERIFRRHPAPPPKKTKEERRAWKLWKKETKGAFPESFGALRSAHAGGGHQLFFTFEDESKLVRFVKVPSGQGIDHKYWSIKRSESERSAVRGQDEKMTSWQETSLSDDGVPSDFGPYPFLVPPQRRALVFQSEEGVIRIVPATANRIGDPATIIEIPRHYLQSVSPQH